MRCTPLVLLLTVALTTSAADNLRLQVVTIATEETDGYNRFMRSANMFNLSVEVVGMGVAWRGGDIVRFPGGGHKVNMLRPVVDKWREEQNTVVMFVDSYDVIFGAGEEEILAKFLDFSAKVVFSAEGFCWPDQSLASKYPRVGLGKRFLCSGGFIGYAPDVWQIVSDHEIADTEDDQLYYTLIYLDMDKRAKFEMRLDHRSHIFQNLNGAKDEVELKFLQNVTYAYNSIYNTRAVVYHGNGPSKIYLNFIGNYIPNSWNEQDGCTMCKETERPLPGKRADWPTVLLALFIEKPSPFLPEMLERVTQLDYPKDRMTLRVHCGSPHHESLVGAWYEIISSDYANSSYSGPEDSEPNARKKAMVMCLSSRCDYLFAMDAVAMLDQEYTLWSLIQINRNVVAPLLVRPHRMFSNFWGDVASNGFYARSHDYQQIIDGNRRGVWNVPFINAAVLFSGSWLQRHAEELPDYYSDEWEPDLAFAKWMRDRGHFMYVSNIQEYGHLLNADNYDTSHLHNDMYQLFDNRMDWEHKYIHPNWSKLLNEDWEVEMPCPDVYWYPLVSEAFCKELVEELEHFGKWSGGAHSDVRISGGYENVPTRDIHMNQVGFEPHWLEVIRAYVVPVQIKVFPGYYSRGHSVMNFVVKYWPEGQSSLRPHHDSSTFTINVALTRRGIDYEGGGCRFVRQNCSITNTRIGWSFMHPGRLTHFHEGLPTTKGTRYIMISFIDP